MKRSVMLAVALTGCSGVQSAGAPSAREAEATSQLFGIFLIVCLFFFLAVIVFLAMAVVRSPTRSGERVLRRALIAWSGLIVVGLLGLTLASYATDRSLAALSAAESPLRIRITAQQWWWKVEYLDPDPSKQFATANELHLPVGRLAHIELVSDDVIHSLWLPPLAGKQDLIPGRRTDIEITPKQAGRFRGQCAEFCGQQHAWMALETTVEASSAFESWRANARAPAKPPQDQLAQQGYGYFMNGPCSACHTISGTVARGTVGPDLTHLANRPVLAAGALSNTLGHLEGWISNAQAIKPGARMPDIDIAPADLHAVAAYLQGLT